MFWIGCYTVMTLTTYLDLVMTIRVTERIKISSPTKNRKQLADDITELKNLKKYSAIWPYVIYKLHQK